MVKNADQRKTVRKERKKGDKDKGGKKEEEFWIFKQILNQCGENLKNALIKCEVKSV